MSDFSEINTNFVNKYIEQGYSNTEIAATQLATALSIYRSTFNKKDFYELMANIAEASRNFDRNLH